MEQDRTLTEANDWSEWEEVSGDIFASRKGNFHLFERRYLSYNDMFELRVYTAVY